MIIGMGVDIVEIDRFKAWRSFACQQLLHAFSEQEIEYCMSNEAKSAERFAVRFAAREAFFKAISAVSPRPTIPLLTVCKNVAVVRDECGICQLAVDWNALNLMRLTGCKVHVSLSHNQSQAIAMVILEQ